MEARYPFETQDTEDISLTKVTGMYQNWFLDYASYVILERAIPTLEDGLKPVQRRILHSMKDLEDGRYNKVANIVGHTMQYHPHGDASIADAMIQLGQKELLIDTQGNWGNILTGDSAAASRYIEARLSKFALEIVFSPKVTQWQLSYDGRKQEPIYLPVKFPLLLAQGVEGIAVGLSTKILPHNFNELIDASIKYLRNKPFDLYPDFLTGGIMDVNQYNEGKRGGKIRIRAKISTVDRCTLKITELPYSLNTNTLIDSVIKANEKGKIKIKKIEDNTSDKVEILIHLSQGISIDKTIDALYAFTSCELSVSPLACIIENNKPAFLGVKEILKKSTDNTVDKLRAEQEIALKELQYQWHFLSLESIFIKHKIYRDIEEKRTWEGVLDAIKIGLAPHTKSLKLPVTDEDIIKLTEIKIKRISKFDSEKAQLKLAALEDEIELIKHNLDNIIDFSIKYFQRLKKHYGKDKKRKTEIQAFEDIEATKVVMKNQKLYVNKEEGFVGYGLKKNEFICACSDIDDIIVFTKSGKLLITKISDKYFVEKNIIYANVFRKKDKRTIYNVIYKDGRGGPSFIKRFYVAGITRDKVYDLTQGKSGSEILYFSANYNGEAELVRLNLRQTGALKKVSWDVDFSKIDIKGRGVKGNIITRNPVKKIALKSEGKSTLKPIKYWYDDKTNRLNIDESGVLLGEFKTQDKILTVYKNGVLNIIDPNVLTHFDNNLLLIEKLNTDLPLNLLFLDAKKQKYYLKRFLLEQNFQNQLIITDHPDSYIEWVSTKKNTVLQIDFYKKRNQTQAPRTIVEVDDYIELKGLKTLGKLISSEKIKSIKVFNQVPKKKR